MKVLRSLMISAGFLTSLLVVESVISNGEGALVSTAKAQGELCSEATIEGPYAFAIQGNVQGVGPIAASGTTTFDGFEQVTISGFINTTAGTPAIQTTVSGTYTVNPVACTGSATVNIPPPGLFGRFTQLTFQAVIVGDGDEIRYLITTPGVVFAGASVRQFP